MGRPVVFTQHRYGYNGRVFKLYKFRTMIRNADSMQAQLRTMNERDGAAFKMKDDPRVTPLGRALRKTSIDELPQLINVIKGDMSIVGPRPLPLADYERMDNISHRRRLSVLPGITGTWQISGRDNISFDEWMKMDLDYIDNWRLATDLKIILLTVPIVLFGHGSK
jgi:lipopolysaccharide/colanic/teichoic acid biosynthesis glycosyltransferase